MFSLVQTVLQNFDPQPPTKEVPNQRSSIAGFLAIVAVPVFFFYVAFNAAFSTIYYPANVVCICVTNQTMQNSWFPNDDQKLKKLIHS
jgi:hypothetical protein